MLFVHSTAYLRWDRASTVTLATCRLRLQSLRSTSRKSMQCFVSMKHLCATSSMRLLMAMEVAHASSLAPPLTSRLSVVC